MSRYVMMPPQLWKQTANEWNLIGSQVNSGQTVSGIFSSARLDGGGAWSASINPFLYGSYFSRDGDTHRAYRSFRTIANGGATPVVVPRIDIIQPWALDAFGNEIRALDTIGVPWGEDIQWGDDVNWGGSDRLIHIESATGAALHSTAMRVRILAGGDLKGGEDFSIDHPNKDWHLYEIGTAVPLGSSLWDITFLPPLREAVSIQIPLEFELPRCVMRLTSPASANYKLDAPWFSTPSMNFIEHLG